MNPSSLSSCRYKISELGALLNDSENNGNIVAFLAITETWLEPYISDAQVHIENYTLSRCDRSGRGGGVCLYTHINTPISEELKYDDGVCQVLLTVMPNIEMCNIVIYRPPESVFSSFKGAVNFIEDFLNSLDVSYQICISGDLNFPCIDWDLLLVKSGSTSNTKNSAEIFLKLLSSHMMNQYVRTATRGNNILDVFCTNNPFLVLNLEVKYTPISDHKMINISMSLDSRGLEVNSAIVPNSGFSELNFSKADFNKISNCIRNVNWESLWKDSDFEMFPSLMTDTLLRICQKHVPQRRRKSGKPKICNSLRRKRKRLENRLSRSTNAVSTQQIERELALTYYEIKEAHYNRKYNEEACAVNRIRENPKVFYSYAKSHSKINKDVNIIKDSEGNMTSDPEDMAEILA